MTTSSAVAILVLIIIPFSFALLLPLSSPYFKLKSPFISGRGQWDGFILFMLSATPGFIISGVYKEKLRDFVFKDFVKSDDETAVNEYRYITTIIYIEIFVILLLTIFYYIIPVSIKDQIPILPLVLGDGFYWTQSTLTWSVYLGFLAILPTYLSRNFRFYFARKSIMVAADKKDEVKKIRYLMIALNSYNKFIKRNLQLEFDKAKVCSRILSSEDKNKDIDPLSLFV